MQLTDSQGLPCPTENDFITALDLQTLAEAVDAKVAALNARFSVAAFAPGAILASNANQSVPTGVPSVNITNVTTQVVTVYDTGNQNISAGFANILVSGIWAFGAYANVIAAGAVTVNTVRQLSIDMEIQSSSSDVTKINFAERVSESNTGGEFITVSGVMPVRLGPGQSADVRLGFAHNNGTSNVIVQSGAYVWFYRVGNLED
jgi:hypothetical protein